MKFDEVTPPMPWQEHLRQWIRQSGGEEVGPLTALREHLSPEEFEANVHRYEGEDMGAYSVLSGYVGLIEQGTPATEVLERIQERFQNLTRHMEWAGYDFESGPGRVYSPSFAELPDADRARKVHHAFDVAMNVWNGGDPGLEYIVEVLADTLGGELGWDPETVYDDVDGRIYVSTKCHAGKHLLLENDNLEVVTIPAPDSGPENIVQAATGRKWLPLCRRCAEDGYFNQPRDIGEVTDLASLYLPIGDEDHEQIRRHLRDVSQVSDVAADEDERDE